MIQLRNIEPSSACNYYRGDKGILYNQREGDTSVSSVFFFSFLVTKSLIQLFGVMIQKSTLFSFTNQPGFSSQEYVFCSIDCKN